jgi:hypothetical protein
VYAGPDVSQPRGELQGPLTLLERLAGFDAMGY